MRLPIQDTQEMRVPRGHEAGMFFQLHEVTTSPWGQTFPSTPAVRLNPRLSGAEPRRQYSVFG